MSRAHYRRACLPWMPDDAPGPACGAGVTARIKPELMLTGDPAKVDCQRCRKVALLDVLPAVAADRTTAGPDLLRDRMVAGARWLEQGAGADSATAARALALARDLLWFDGLMRTGHPWPAVWASRYEDHHLPEENR